MYTYTVLVTDANGCISTASVNVIYTNIDCSNQQNSTKVKICMVNSGNPANCQTVCLSINAAQNLLNNGSYIGPCLPNCAIPQARTNSSAPNMNNDVELNIYPNPAHQSVHIAYISKRENKYEINLIDVLGRTIQVIKGTSVVGENDIEINLQQLSKGIYQLVFIQNEIQEVKKLVVE
ncbi:MAG: T9SS type A sorting domain-containing protein [Nitrosopumilus sp.]|nr:T9SS type A sorting domain-containing protein [Nitrosopumilus sp.]